jgi:hypothetical protein
MRMEVLRMRRRDHEWLEEASGAAGTDGMRPLLVPTERAFRALGIGRTKGFELIRDGRLVARKIGSKTLVEVESMRRFAASLPRAGRER